MALSGKRRSIGSRNTTSQSGLRPPRATSRRPIEATKLVRRPSPGLFRLTPASRRRSTIKKRIRQPALSTPDMPSAAAKVAGSPCPLQSTTPASTSSWPSLRSEQPTASKTAVRLRRNRRTTRGGLARGSRRNLQPPGCSQPKGSSARRPQSLVPRSRRPHQPAARSPMAATGHATSQYLDDDGLFTCDD